jgi:hypothetical protein
LNEIIIPKLKAKIFLIKVPERRSGAFRQKKSPGYTNARKKGSRTPFWLAFF